MNDESNRVAPHPGWRVAGTTLLLAALGLPALPAAAAVVFQGWNAGVSATRFDWSSDLFDARLLGLPDIACVYAQVTATCADSRYPHGSTTPPGLPAFSLIAGQTVSTRAERSIGGPMRAAMTAELQAAGDIEGGVTHFRFDNAVPSLARFGYGLFTLGQGLGRLEFGGIGPQTALYYFMEWELQASATDGGARMDYGLEISGADATLRGNGLPLQALSGSRAGSVTGVSVLSPQFLFGLHTPAGVGTPQTLATGSLDIWLTFSTQPIFDLPNDGGGGGGGTVPEPAPWALLGAAAAAAVTRRRLKQL